MSKGELSTENNNCNEMKADLDTLVDCIKRSLTEPEQLKQGLNAIESTCSQSDQAQLHLYKCGGLSLIYSLAVSPIDDTVRQVALYCVARCMEKNVIIQNDYNKMEVFNQMLEILSDVDRSLVLKNSATYFLLVLITNNSTGQVLTMKSGCIRMLLHMFRTLLVFDIPSCDPCLISLWSSVASTLSAAMNNPINDENQALCGIVLPYACQLLTRDDDTAKASVASFITYTVDNNVLNQNRVYDHGGLEAILDIIETGLRGDCGDFLSIIFVKTLDACIKDNARCIAKAGELFVSKILLSFLLNPGLSTSYLLQITLTLGHSMDNSLKNRASFQQYNGVNILVKLLSNNDDEDLQKALKFTLNVAVADGPQESFDMNNNQSNCLTNELLLDRIQELSEQLDTWQYEQTMSHDILDNVTNSNGRRSLQISGSKPKTSYPLTNSYSTQSGFVTKKARIGGLGSESIHRFTRTRDYATNINNVEMLPLSENRNVGNINVGDERSLIKNQSENSWLNTRIRKNRFWKNTADKTLPLGENLASIDKCRNKSMSVDCVQFVNDLVDDEDTLEIVNYYSDVLDIIDNCCYLKDDEIDRPRAVCHSKGEGLVGSQGEAAVNSKALTLVGSKGEALIHSKGEESHSEDEPVIGSKGEAVIGSKGEAQICSKGESVIGSKGEAVIGSKGEAPICSKGEAVIGSKGEVSYAKGEAVIGSKVGASHAKGKAVISSKDGASIASTGETVIGSKGEKGSIRSKGKAVIGSKVEASHARGKAVIGSVVEASRANGEALVSSNGDVPVCSKGVVVIGSKVEASRSKGDAVVNSHGSSSLQENNHKIGSDVGSTLDESVDDRLEKCDDYVIKDAVASLKLQLLQETTRRKSLERETSMLRKSLLETEQKERERTELVMEIEDQGIDSQKSSDGKATNESCDELPEITNQSRHQNDKENSKTTLNAITDTPQVTHNNLTQCSDPKDFHTPALSGKSLLKYCRENGKSVTSLIRGHKQRIGVTRPMRRMNEDTFDFGSPLCTSTPYTTKLRLHSTMNNASDESLYEDDSLRVRNHRVYSTNHSSPYIDVVTVSPASMKPTYRETGTGPIGSNRHNISLNSSMQSERRTRVDYTQQEVHNLVHGVRRLGTLWTQILYGYEFNPSRTAVDLKEKYKRIVEKSRKQRPNRER